MINISLNPIHNIVIVGEIGVGKGSLINLVTGKDSAITAYDVRGVTTKTESHDWINEGQTFRLWNTPGLNEGSFGTVSPKQAQDAIRSLLTELSKGDGVHLLVLCMRGLPRVTKGMKLTYDTIQRIRNKTAPDTPLIAVVTDLEKRSAQPDILRSMDEWWMNNNKMLFEYGMLFSDHACITTLPDNCHPKLLGRHELCQGLVRRVITEGVSQKLVCNVIIAGGVGVGKSSLVNLVLNSERAVVANDFGPVTSAISYYDCKIDNQIFRLWDTPGLKEGPRGVGLQRTREALPSLFSDLNEKGGAHLLVICISGLSGITMAAKKTCDLIIKMRERFSPTTPVVVVITGLESWSHATNVPVSMEGWWTTNSARLDMSFSEHACITTVSDNSHPQLPGRRELCRELVRNLIISQSLRPQAAPPKDLHILLFGEAGVGKSAVINLLAGRQIALVSSRIATCTLDSCEYQFQLGSTTIHLWDTMGLGDPYSDSISIRKALQLIQRLNKAGGISLFLLCIRDGRITRTMQGYYRLFYEVLGKKEVPVALIATHMEMEVDMENWWQRHNIELEMSGMLFAGHACLTALEGHPRCAESREILQGLLSSFDDQGKFSMPSEAWIGRVLKRLGSVVGKSDPKGKDLVRILTERCYLELGVAQRVAAYIDGDMSVDEEESREPQKRNDKPGEQSQAEPTGEPESGPEPEPEPESESESESESEPGDMNGWWIDERFGPDSSNCISLPIFS